MSFHKCFSNTTPRDNMFSTVYKLKSWRKVEPRPRPPTCKCWGTLRQMESTTDADRRRTFAVFFVLQRVNFKERRDSDHQLIRSVWFFSFNWTWSTAEERFPASLSVEKKAEFAAKTWRWWYEVSTFTQNVNAHAVTGMKIHTSRKIIYSIAPIHRSINQFSRTEQNVNIKKKSAKN